MQTNLQHLSEWRASGDCIKLRAHSPTMYRLVCVLFAMLAFLLGAGGTAPRVHNVLLSRLRTEPVVAVDPTNPSVIVAGANTNYLRQPDGTFPSPYFTSQDGGRSFSVGTLPIPQPYTTGADPSMGIARDGTVFYSYLAESPTYCSDGPGAVLLTHSTDHGVSFRAPVVVDSNPADDRPTMAVESVPGRASHLFVAWTRSYPHRSEIWLTRSADGGATFEPAILLWSSPLDNFGAEPVVGPHQHVYVVWLSHSDVAPADVGPAQVLLTASDDDGVHFGPVHGAGRGFSTLPQLEQPGALRNLTTAAAAVAPSGVLYVAYAAVRARHPDGSVDADIWLERSLDDGTTWLQPKRVNDVRRGDRFMPSLSVLADRTIGLAFYDRRNSPEELDVDAARVSLLRGFKAAVNVRVNTASSPITDISNFRGYHSEGDSCFPPGRFFGDYLGTAANGTSLDVVWADTQLHQRNETDLWFARIAFPSVPSSPHRVPTQARHGWAALVSRLPAITRHIPTGGLSGGELFLGCLILLLPALTVATVFTSLRDAKRSQYPPYWKV